MKSKSILLAGFLFFLFIIPLHCEFYQYVDKNGVKHFTDNAAEIPEDQRNTSNIYQSVDPTENARPEVDSPQEDQPAPSEDTITAESLTNQKVELEKEFNVLVEKKQNLDALKEELSEPEYNERINQLNLEIERYNKKKEQFTDRVNQFNSRVSSKQPDTSDSDLKDETPPEDTQTPEEPGIYEYLEESE